MATQADQSGTIMDVGHIVILMQENRSFDHYFGTMDGVRGFGDRFTIPVAPGPDNPEGSVWFQRNDNPGAERRVVAPFRLDSSESFGVMRVAGTPHLWPNAQRAWNHGVLDQWPTYKQNHAMAYYTEADIPFQFALARLFTVCDAYHCSFQGGTNPNRVFAWTGTNDGLQQGYGPVIGNRYDNLAHDPAGGYAWTTYPERLLAAGISWQVYQDMADNYTDNPLVGFRSYRNAHAGLPGADLRLHERALATRDLVRFRQDVQSGSLPQVSFIVATAAGSEHPVPSSPAQGAEYTAALLEALASNPEVWRKTVLFLMFDENDGFFDHAPPPAPPSCLQWHADPAQALLAGASTVATAGEYHLFASADPTDDPTLRHRPYGLGPRVPMYAISPWSRGGWVNSEVFDHTSVIRFMERRFGVIETNISPWRRAVCGDLTSAFDFTTHDPSAFLAALPDTAALAQRVRSIGAPARPVAPAPLRPLQAPGVRPSRALPYALEVSDRLAPDGRSLTLVFFNTGAAGAVFHVYDQLAPGSIPRRYTVEAGKELAGHWQPAGAGGQYDLWVLGPNGFHRRFAAHTGAGLHLPRPLLRVACDGAAQTLTVRLSNSGARKATFVVTANAYLDSAGQVIGVQPDTHVSHTASVADTGGWYDFSLRIEEMPGYLRRFAGRIENGRASISDPAMGGLNRVD